MRQGDVGLDATQIHFDRVVIPGVRVGLEVHPIRFTPLGAEERARDLIAWEQGGGHAQFGPHVRDGGPFRDREGENSRASILEHRPDIALGGQLFQQLEDDILGRHPRVQFALQVHPDDLRVRQEKRPAGHGHGDIQPPGADRQHPHGTRRGRVAVGAEQGPARARQSFQVHLVADAVAGLRKENPVFRRNRAQVFMVVGVLEALLQHEMVHV